MARSIIGAFLAFLLAAMVAWSASLRVEGPVVSTVTGVAPLEITSATKVTNLNADLLDGMNASDFATQTQVAAIYNQVFFAADATFVVPQGVQVLEVTVTGAGGGAGGGIENNSLTGGGGGSGFVLSAAVLVTQGESLAIEVGEGGSGGVAGVEDADGGDGEPSILSSNVSPWRLEAVGGKGGANLFGYGGNGWFGGGGGDDAGGIGVVGSGQAGGFQNEGAGGAGASGGAGGGLDGGGGGGGPGGGHGGLNGSPGQPGIQPGAGGGGGGHGGYGGHGADGAILIRWVGPPPT